jgi:hypothetical protein
VFSFNKRPHRAAAALLALGFSAGDLGGCASHSGNIALAIDPSDPCGQLRNDLSQSRTYFTDQIVTGAVTGGALGAIGGALIGGATGGGRGALAGALVGGAAGAIAGGASAYYSTMADRYHDQATLARSINSDLDRESAQMDHVNATFARLRECRFGVAQQVKYQVRTGQVPRSAAISTLDFQRTMFTQEIEVARAYGVNMQKRDDEFRVAAEKLNGPSGSSYGSSGGTYTTGAYTTAGGPGNGPRRRPSPASSPTQQVVTNATETIPEKRRSFVASVDDASKRSQVAFNIDAAGAA